jgi:UDP-hydrolysing UDP-N-acetyl-D-glucosamine 2-epimerase
MGESTSRIFNIGSISLDKFANIDATIDLNAHFMRPIPQEFAVLIFHPLMGEDSASALANILGALDDLKIFTFVGYPNSDPGHRQLVSKIEAYGDNPNFLPYKNINRDVFISLLSRCKFLIGNSSAGIYEMASMNKPAINVGLRQKGRMCADNVIFSGTSTADIRTAIEQVDSPAFQEKLLGITNPYGDGNSAIQAYNLIKTLDGRSFLPKIEDPLEEF